MPQPRLCPPPPPPPPPQSAPATGGSLSPWQQTIGAQQAWQQQLWQQQLWQQQMLERELASTRAELEAMQELLQELPEIFERKFQQRLKPLLDHQQRLLSENEGLRSQMRLLRPAADPPAAASAAPTEATEAQPAARPPLQWQPFQPASAPPPPPPESELRPEAPPPAPEATGPEPARRPLLPQLPQRPRIPQAVRHAFGLGPRRRKPLRRRPDGEPPTDG